MPYFITATTRVGDLHVINIDIVDAREQRSLGPSRLSISDR